MADKPHSRKSTRKMPPQSGTLENQPRASAPPTNPRLHSSPHQTALTLAELEGRYGELGYLRVSKSAVINLHRIRSLKSRTGGRIEASLENGERLVVSRHYAPPLRERLGL